MTKIGTTVVYGTQVCKIADRRKQTIGKLTREYYVLVPVFDQKNTSYVPVDNERLVAKMRKILSPEEIYALINALPETDSVWVTDDKQRTAEFKAVVEGGDPAEIIAVIKTLYERARELEAKGRRLHAVDEQILARAEKVVYEEFSLVLDIKRDEVVPFIARQIEIANK